MISSHHSITAMVMAAADITSETIFVTEAEIHNPAEVFTEQIMMILEIVVVVMVIAVAIVQ